MSKKIMYLLLIFLLSCHNKNYLHKALYKEQYKLNSFYAYPLNESRKKMLSNKQVQLIINRVDTLWLIESVNDENATDNQIITWSNKRDSVIIFNNEESIDIVKYNNFKHLVKDTVEKMINLSIRTPVFGGDVGFVSMITKNKTKSTYYRDFWLREQL